MKDNKRKEKVTAPCDYSSDIDGCKIIDTANYGFAPKE